MNLTTKNNKVRKREGRVTQQTTGGLLEDIGYLISNSQTHTPKVVGLSYKYGKQYWDEIT